ncbi:MAG TPA: hypothetical protein VHO70_01065, partial [Chitinispirillaceae bacterium]|nr:hypothetical protein [Chitinispirillaceae bacterium]
FQIIKETCDECTKYLIELDTEIFFFHGFFYECRGDAAVFDMSGNAAEWTESQNGDPYVYGGSWQSGENESTCDSKFQLKGGGKYFYVGFRCCK